MPIASPTPAGNQGRYTMADIRALAPSEARTENSAPTTALSPYAEFMLRVAERFGVPTVLLVLVVWWVKADIVQPLMTAHFDTVNKIVAGQSEHTRGLQSLGDKLDKLIQVSSETP